MIPFARWLLTGIALMTLARPAHAIDDAQRAVTRALVKGAVERYNQGRYKEARDDLDAALRVAQVPAIAWWAGRAHAQLGELVDAARLYSAAMLMQPDELWTDMETQRQAQSEAQHALAAILPRVQTVRIVLMGATTARGNVTLDGAKVPGLALHMKLPLKPGAHDLKVSDGGRTVSEQVTLLPREHKTVTIDLARLAPPSAVTTQTQPANGTQRTAGLMILGAGIAGLVLGATAGGIAWAKHSSLEGCPSGCTEGTVNRTQAESHDTWRTVSMVGFAVGGVGTAVGVTLLLTEPKQDNTPRVGLFLAPNALSVRGAF